MTSTDGDQHDPQEGARRALLKKIAEQAGRSRSSNTTRNLAEAYALVVAPQRVTGQVVRIGTMTAIAQMPVPDVSVEEAN